MKSDFRGRQLFALRNLQLQPMKIEGVNVAASTLKSVLRAIDDHGEMCWASTSTIAFETCLCEKSVRRALKALEAQRLVSIESRSGQSSCVVINWNFILTPVSVTAPSGRPTPVTESRTPVTESAHPGNTVQNPGNSYRRSEKKRNRSEKKRESAPAVPELSDVLIFWKSNALSGSPEKFFYHHQAKGWCGGDWRSLAHKWSVSEVDFPKGKPVARRTANVGAGVNYQPELEGTNVVNKF